MITISSVDPRHNADRLFRLFDENDEDATHPRAVIADGSCQLWVAEEGERLAAALLGREERSNDGRLRGFVDNLLVDAAYRRRGIGRRLMEEAEAHYRARSLFGMQLATRVDNAVARALYESLGYRVVHEYVRTRREPHERRVRMWKDFAASGLS